MPLLQVYNSMNLFLQFFFTNDLICIFVFRFQGNYTNTIVNGKNHQRGLFKVV